MSKMGDFIIDVCEDFANRMTPSQIARKYSKNSGVKWRTVDILRILNDYYDPDTYEKEAQ